MLSEVTFVVEGGRGGDGAVSFRRERYEPRGGPDGGDGGDGGSVVLRAEDSWRGLEEIRPRKRIRAGDGGGGAAGRKHGRRGPDELVLVPAGTSVSLKVEDEWKVRADLLADGGEIVVAHGGQGGAGNARFATSTNQAPRIAERGLPGERFEVRLELRVLADVGLVGLPNAGKSSLLNAMTSAEAKVGVYGFTTLEPQLGVVEVGHERFVMADIPGLVSGASEGRGLGSEFLRQIERTTVLLFVLDGARDRPAEDLKRLRTEIEAYDRGLGEKQKVLAVNKSDLLGDPQSQDVVDELSRQGQPAYLVSAKSGHGLQNLAQALLKRVRAAPAEATDRRSQVKGRPPEKPIRARRDGDAYRLEGERAEMEVARLGTASAEARREIWRRLSRTGAVKALRRAGARPGDMVAIGDSELELPA
jgi:GTPase